jgi:hypothetical protein
MVKAAEGKGEGMQERAQRRRRAADRVAAIYCLEHFSRILHERSCAAMKAQAVTLNFFPSGDDLPIFSGALVAVAVRPFVPSPVARQESLLDLRLDPFHTLEPGAPGAGIETNEEEAPWTPE